MTFLPSHDRIKVSKKVERNTNMPVKELSFRIGCGRYLQEKGALSKISEEILRLGRAPLIVGGKTALALAYGTIVDSLEGKCNKYEFVAHPGTCNEEDAQAIAQIAAEKGYDVIVGVGGGVIMDFAKLCAYFAKLPLINVPTSSATCAAYTPLSVRYTKEGKTVGSLHYAYEVNAVIVDPEVIVTQPVRLLLAGVFDALAKFVEIKQRFREDGSMEYPLGLDYAYFLSKQTYHVLNEKTVAAIRDMEKGEITYDFEQLIFTSICTTGVISGIARGSNQCAIAHKFYETTRTLFHENARPYLHGEIVGIGLLIQNFFNGEKENNRDLIALMKKNGMPYRPSDVGITVDEQTRKKYYDLIAKSSAINGENQEECEKLDQALSYLWRMN